MWLFIESSDVWLFRDGRPFDAGADHRAGSLFPPNATTLQGAIRSKMLALYGVDPEAYRERDETNANVAAVAAQIGYPARRQNGQVVQTAEPGNVRLRGPFLARRETAGNETQIMPYFPCPADVLKIETDETKKLAPLHPAPNPAFAANWPDDAPNLWPMTFGDVGDETPEGIDAWVSAEALGRYLGDKNSLNYSDLVQPGDLFGPEPRLGIGVDSSVKRPEDGMLYQVSYVRPKDEAGLLVQVTGLDQAAEERLGQGGLLSLGGETRAASYTVVNQPPAWPKSQIDEDKGKLVLATPTYFGGGWQAANWAAFFAGAPRLAAAVVHRHQLVGGWDVAHNRPKPAQRYVPAGAVYYFDGALDETADFIGDDPAAGRIGFGAYFIGRW